MSDPDNWLNLERELRALLAEGVEIGGTVEETHIGGSIDGSMLELVIELSDLEGAEQEAAYLVLCDLLTTRRNQGADRVLGCLVFVPKLDPGALVIGLRRMTRDTGLFTPILPLSRSQAALLAITCTTGAEFLDDATAVVTAAADGSDPTRELAQILLDDIEQVVNQHTG